MLQACLSIHADLCAFAFSCRAVGTAGARPVRPAVDATRHATAAPSASTKIGRSTITSVARLSKVSKPPLELPRQAGWGWARHRLSRTQWPPVPPSPAWLWPSAPVTVVRPPPHVLARQPRQRLWTRRPARKAEGEGYRDTDRPPTDAAANVSLQMEKKNCIQCKSSAT